MFGGARPQLERYQYVPLALAAVGIFSGLILAWWLVSSYPSLAQGQGRGNFEYSVALSGAFLGCCFGYLGNLLGEAVVSRWSRAA